MTDTIETECINTIKELLEKYKNSEYMIQRIKSHITINLINTLDNEFKNYEERITRNTFLNNEQQLFIQVFLNKNKYFYLPNNNFFYEYTNEKYFIIKEDDIIDKLLSSISKGKVLLQWKHKTKINIIKLIKERNLFNSIPDTDTIQNILNVLYPTFFNSKNAAKYFLTVIGDNIFKNNQNLIFLVTPTIKQFLNEIDNVGILSIGNNNITNNFMTKYHENHSYENCRLIKINDNFSNEIWRELLKKIGLDFFCVAAHYSKRYENSDNFIEQKLDEELKTYSYYLKNATPISIIDDFCNKYVIHSQDCFIEWKNLHFVWKQFLSNLHLPNIIYSNCLKQMLKDKYLYNDSNDSFINITSKYLPIYSNFIKFWEETIQVDDTTTIFDNELEIEELSTLFKLWIKETSEQLINGNISEENIVKILKHFFPNVEIIENKYLLNVTSKMWNKNNDIQESFDFIKDKIKNKHKLDVVCFDDVYNYYYKFCNLKSLKIVSKRYFEKYLYYKLSDFIVFEKFIKKEWFLG
jgi:hypothetical protein